MTKQKEFWMDNGQYRRRVSESDFKRYLDKGFWPVNPPELDVPEGKIIVSGSAVLKPRLMSTINLTIKEEGEE